MRKKLTVFIATLLVTIGSMNGQGVVDKTSKIKNPNFSTGDKGTGDWMNCTTSNKSMAPFSGWFMDYWRNSTGVLDDKDIYQSVNVDADLPNGYYTLSADVMACNEGNTSLNVTGVRLYANSNYTECFTQKGLPKSFNVLFALSGETSFQIGVKTVSTTANWIAADNFKLSYYGTLTDMKATAEALLLEPKMHSEERSSLTGKLNAVNGIADGVVSEAVVELNAAITTAQASADAYVSIKRAQTIANNRMLYFINEAAYSDYQQAYNVIDALYNSDADVATINTALTTFASAYYPIEKALRAPSIGIDRTNLIINPKFDVNPTTPETGGWSSSWAGKLDYNNYQLWAPTDVTGADQTFTFSQSINNVPSAVYQLSVQGFIRVAPTNSNYNKGLEDGKTYLYAEAGGREYKIPLLSVYAEGLATFTQSGANTAFNTNNWYLNNALKGIVVNAGETLTIGIKGEREYSETWMCFDNFKLTAIDDIVLNDEQDLNLTGDFDATVSYVRSFSAQGVNTESKNGWQTICLPYAATVKFGEKPLAPNTDFWLFKATSAGYELTNTIEPNTMYLIAMPNDEDVYAEGMNIEGDVTFSGDRIIKPAVTPIEVAIGSSYKLVADYKASYAIGTDKFGITDYNTSSEMVSAFDKTVSNGAFWPYAIRTGIGMDASRFGIFDNNSVTGIRQISNAGKAPIVAVAVQGGVEITTTQSQRVQIGTIEGRSIQTIRVPEGTSIIPLPVGTYLINGTKVIINF